MKKFIFMLAMVMVMFGVNTAYAGHGTEHDYPYTCDVCGTSYYWGTCQYSGCSSARSDHTYNCSKCGTTICPNNTSHTCVCTHDYVYQRTTATTSTHTNHFTCSKCGKTREDTFSHEYEYTSWTYTNSKTHNRDGNCKYCTASTSESASHSGGTATCTSGPICSGCGSEYGSATGHSWVYQYSSSTGSSTSHSNKYTCSKCGVTGNNTDSHHWSYGSWSSDSSGHTRSVSCSDCGYSYNQQGSHSGGSNTCTSGAVCSTCGYTYGSAKGHTSESYWRNDETGHWKECVRCSYKTVSKTSHVDTSSVDGICDVCSYEVGHTHTLGSWTTSGSDHIQTCTTCQETVNTHTPTWNYATYDSSSHTKTCSTCSISETEAHTGSTATCTSVATCSVCGEVYGSANGHTLGSWTTSGSDHIQTCTTCQETVNTHTPTWNYATYDSSSHTKTCSTCSISETETHTDTSPVDNTCDKCGETLSTSHEHNYNTVCSVCNSYYYGTCTVSGCSSTKEAHSYSCSTCGTTICPNQTTHTCSATGTYRNVIKAKGTLLRVTSLPGSVITIIPKTAEITGWEVEEGNITILNNMFTMPAGNVVINAIV